MQANLAAVFHWPPDVLDDLSIDDLKRWHELALERIESKG